MTSTQALVSVVIPAYNHEALVQRAIRSVLSQTYSPIELVVVDDGSTDGTWERIQQIHREERQSFSVITKPNSGVSATLNLGIRHTTGHFIAPLASDDHFAPSKIQKQVQLFADSSADVALVHSSAYQDYGDGQVICNHGTYRPAIGHCLKDLLSLKVGIVSPSIMFTREAYNRVGGFDESMIAEDVDFFAGLASAGYAFAYDPEPLVYKTVTANNLGAQVKKWFDVHHRTLAKHSAQFTPRERVAISASIYRSLGRTASGVGELRLALHAFHSAAQETATLGPYAEFLASAARHLILRSFPPGLRRTLRSARSQHYGRRQQPTKQPPSTESSEKT